MFVIVTGLTSGKGTDVKGKPQKNVSFAEMVVKTRAACRRLRYRLLVYDLGGYPGGIPLDPGSGQFQEKGYYGRWKGGPPGWVSVAQHKPRLVRRAMEDLREELPAGSFTLVYIDADVVLHRSLEALDEFSDFDVALCVRREKYARENVGYVNAGVMFFRDRPGTRAFIDRWQKLVEEDGLDDQFVVNKLCDSLRRKPSLGGVKTLQLGGGGTRVRMLDCWEYNNFYFDKWKSQVPGRAKLIHFKQDLRDKFRKWERFL